MKIINKGIIILLIIIIIVLMGGLFLLLRDKDEYIVNQDIKIFEEEINLVLGKVNEIYINDQEYLGIKVLEYRDILKYQKEIEEIQNIYNIDLFEEQYYYLDNLSKAKMGLGELENPYIVNYELGTVYSLVPIMHDGNIMYTIHKANNNSTQINSYTYNNPIIPEKFRYITGSWDTGVVISDVNGNEFVWVPVENLDEKNISTILNSLNDQEQEEKTEKQVIIENSIRKYGGFYIGRYEASLKGATQENSKGNTNILQVKKGIMPISNLSLSLKEYEYVYDNINIGLININIPKYNDGKVYGYTEEGKIAKNEIKEIYNEENKKIEKDKVGIKSAIEMAENMPMDYNWNNNIHTTIIDSEQLELVLKVIKEKRLLTDKKVDGKDAINEDNTLWGNFLNSEFNYYIEDQFVKKNKNEGRLIPTGVITYDDDKKIINNNKVFNIFDLAGNLKEFTLSEQGEDDIIISGGSFDSIGTSVVNNYETIKGNERKSNIGIRVILYID